MWFLINTLYQKFDASSKIRNENDEYTKFFDVKQQKNKC